MNRRFRRPSVALGAVGLALVLAVAVPLFASIADAGPSEADNDVQPSATQAQPGVAHEAAPARSRSVVYGTATETTVTVYRQSLPDGAPEVLFSYENLPFVQPDQRVEAPELALSYDAKSMAYFARSGLRIRDLDSGDDRVVIGRSERPGADPDDPPIWSIDELNPPADSDPDQSHWFTMLSLGDIAFSPDGRFLSFAGHWYEYGDHWVIELATGRAWDDPGSSDLAWSPSSDRVAVAGPSYSDPGELAVSAPGAFDRYETIRPVPGATAELGYEEVEFSPTGDRIAFAYDENRQWPAEQTVRLATSKVDGTGFTALDASGWPGTFAFSADGNNLYSARRDGTQSYLVIHSLTGEAQGLAALPPDFVLVPDLWVTSSGELAVVGGAQLGHQDFTRRLVLFSPDGKQLESTPSFTQTTRFIGVV